MHLPRRQSDFATGNSERPGPEIDRDRQDRPAPEIHFEERPSLFGAPEAGERQSRFRVCRESAKGEEGTGARKAAVAKT